MFPARDLRRIWLILGCLATLEKASIKAIGQETGLPRPTVSDILDRLIEGQIPGLEVTKEGSAYSVSSWGGMINKTGMADFFKVFLSSNS